LFLSGASPKSFTLDGREVAYAALSLGGHSLLESYLDLGASPVGTRGNHDVVHTYLSVVAGGGSHAQQELTQFYTPALSNLPKH